jgi:hypothetical protein
MSEIKRREVLKVPEQASPFHCLVAMTLSFRRISITQMAFRHTVLFVSVLQQHRSALYPAVTPHDAIHFELGFYKLRIP